MTLEPPAIWTAAPKLLPASFSLRLTIETGSSFFAFYFDFNSFADLRPDLSGGGVGNSNVTSAFREIVNNLL
jgi:hypothetical protein